MAYQFLRGNTAENDAYTGPIGSFTIDEEAGNLRIHDGQTAGGFLKVEDLATIQQILSELVVGDIGGLQSALDAKASLSSADFDTMPLVAGAEIVSRGSNANGDWVSFSNGIQISVTTVSGIDVNVNTNSGSYFRSGSVAYTRPISFTSIFWESASDASSANLWGTAAAGGVSLFFSQEILGRTARVVTFGTWN